MRAYARMRVVREGVERYSFPNAAPDDVTMMTRRNAAAPASLPTDEKLDTDLDAAGV